MHVSLEDDEEDCEHEESPAYEGRCDVYGAAAVAVLSAALCSPGKAEPQRGKGFKILELLMTVFTLLMS